jgi:hypothetical protein
VQGERDAENAYYAHCGAVFEAELVQASLTSTLATTSAALRVVTADRDDYIQRARVLREQLDDALTR